MKYLLLDDDTERAERWKSAISLSAKSISVDVFDTKKVSELISNLHKGRLDARKDTYKRVSDLNEYDLIIIDYDLLGLEENGGTAWSTGAELAYAIRLMCDVGPIIVVNQYGTNPFDLTMKRTVSSYADQDLGGHQITNPGLWQSNSFSDFRPWHWPNLSLEPARFNAMRDFILNNLDRSIIQTLGFEILDFSSARFIGHDILGKIGINDTATTFRELIQENREIAVFNVLDKDIDIIKKMDDPQLARLTSVIIWQWLEKVVLPNQEVLSDLPHLAPKMPWILKDYTSEESWNSICDLEIPTAIIDEIGKYQFSPDFLFTRPVYWSEEAKQAIGIPSGFSIDKISDLVFCEDASCFSPRTSASNYPSDLLAFDKERWVKDKLTSDDTEVNYEPQSYLLMM
ncbi:TPA: hypothetical protein ACVGIZ_005005 [Pseudomonas aeruginosa]|uniref:hypothetical protein n=1 Tax=Pseudomonas aeruginosa TaxID=287 RepID=UPI0021AEFA7B|nr:hypothetical protein [Pseudomonas aeruginosa]MCT5662795.1 hypothetical protein [Pseudomonas aeruginosa]